MAYNVENSEKVIQTQLDVTENFLVIPSSKLDADQYVAEDIDGVTESIFGSGNLAYGVLQASQTNAELITNGTFAYAGQGTDVIANGATSVLSNGSSIDDNDVVFDPSREPGQGVTSNPGADTTDGSFSTGTVGSSIASQLASDAGAFNSESLGLNLGGASDGSDGIAGINGVDGDTPIAIDGNDGADGEDASAGDGSKVINVNLGDTIINFGDIDIDIGETVEIIEGLIIDLGDTITTLSGDITNITEILGDVVTNLDILNLSNVTSLITNISNDLTQTIDNTVIEISNITNNVTNILNTLLGGEAGDGGLDLNLDVNILDTLATQVNVPLDDILGTDINLTVDLAPSYTVLQNVADLSGLDILSDTIGELGATVNALQGAINQVTEVVSNLDLNDAGASIEQAVDALENLDNTVGDITDSIDVAVGGVLDNLGIGDADGTLGDTVDGVVSDVGDLADNLTNGAGDDLTDGIEGAIDPITDAVDGLTDDLADKTGDAVEDSIDAITDLADNIVAGLDDGDIFDGLELGGDDPSDGNDGLISQTADPLVNEAGNVIDDVTQGATEDLTNGLDSVFDDVTDLADDLTNDITDGLLGENNDNEDGVDSDVTADLGLDLIDTTLVDEGVDIALDPVEDLVGDVDLSAGLDTDLLNSDSETSNNAGDEDITLDTGIDLVDNTLLEGGVEVPLDPLEEITGDVDLNIDAASDIFNELADPLVNEGEGGTGEETLLSDIGGTLNNIVDGLLSGEDSDSDLLDVSGWTESTISGDGLFDDLVDANSDTGDVLPEPSGTIAEGLGVLNVEPEIDVSSIGGLFG